MRLGVIDIGSNTVKITVFDIDGDIVRDIGSRTVHAKLSSHTSDGRLSARGKDVLIGALFTLRRYARSFGCKKQNVFAFATACIRNSKNRDDILRLVKKSVKLDVTLLSGEQEAELCFRGALAFSGCPSSGVLADIGGGSCEFIEFSNSVSQKKLSLNVGALAMYKKFASDKYLSEGDFRKLSEFLENTFSSDLADVKLPGGGKFIVSGGSARAAVALISKLKDLSPELPFVIDISLAHEICGRICTGELISLCKKTVKERSETLVCALAVLTKASEALGVTSFTVIKGGARNGFAYCFIKKRRKKRRFTKSSIAARRKSL